MMSKRFLWIPIFLAILLTAAAAHANMIEVYENGGFEADAALVPNPGDIREGLPTGWQFDDYNEDGIAPVLMNVSGIGDGSGGTVGLRFPNASGGGKYSAITPLTTSLKPIEVGHYTYTTVFTGIGLDNYLDKYYGGIYTNVYWTSTPNDPWADYDHVADIGWVSSDEIGDGEWTTRSIDFEILPEDLVSGRYIIPYFETKSFRGHIILGEASLVRNNPVPEPGTMLLLGTGILGLAGLRKKLKK